MIAAIFSVIFGSIPWFMCGIYEENFVFSVFLIVRFIQVFFLFFFSFSFSLSPLSLQGMMSGVLETCIMFSISAFFPDRIGQVPFFFFPFLSSPFSFFPSFSYCYLLSFYHFIIFYFFFIFTKKIDPCLSRIGNWSCLYDWSSSWWIDVQPSSLFLDFCW